MKVYIVGSVASGKTTLAKTLSKKTGIKHFELDELIRTYEYGVRRKKTQKELERTFQDLKQMDHWIVEGTYRESCYPLLELSSNILILKMPWLLVRIRIVSRFIKHQLRLESSHYHSDLKMLKLMFKWAKGYEQESYSFQKLLKANHQMIHTCQNKKDITNYKEVFYEICSHNRHTWEFGSS